MKLYHELEKVNSGSFDLGVTIAVFLLGAKNAPPPLRLIGLTWNVLNLEHEED